MQFARYLPDNPWIVAPCGHLPTRHVLVISENIVFPEGPAPGALLIKRTRLQKTLRQDPRNLLEIPRLAETVTNLGGHVLDVGSAVVSPGVVDVHVHLNEPGRPHWEGITAGTHAAAAGGVTTVVDMPINCRPAITSVAAMRYKLRAMRVRPPHPPTCPSDPASGVQLCDWWARARRRRLQSTWRSGRGWCRKTHARMAS